MKRYDIVIAGAGISGLSLAHYCARRGLDTLVIEKNERVGGTFHTHRFAGGASDFWIELGAHTCYNSYGNLLRVMEDCGILGQALKREKVGYKMLVDGEIKSIPSQIHFGELLFSVPRLFTAKKAGQSIESYYSRIVGAANFRRVFGPLFNAVICQEAHDFPADLLFKKRPRRKDVMKSFTLREGLQSITEAIAAQPGIQIVKGKTIETLSFSDGVFGITTADGHVYESGSLAVATSPVVAARLLEAPFPQLAVLLSRIRVETVETVGFMVRKDASPLPPLAGIVAVNEPFYSAVSRDTVRHEKYRGFVFHFKAGAADHDTKLGRISEVLGVKRDQLENVVSTENLVPSLLVGHDSLLAEIDRLIAGERLLLTGNYFSGVAIEDCVSRSLSEFTRLGALMGRKDR